MDTYSDIVSTLVFTVAGAVIVVSVLAVLVLLLALADVTHRALAVALPASLPLAAGLAGDFLSRRKLPPQRRAPRRP